MRSSQQHAAAAAAGTPALQCSIGATRSIARSWKLPGLGSGARGAGGCSSEWRRNAASSGARGRRRGWSVGAPGDIYSLKQTRKRAGAPHSELWHPNPAPPRLPAVPPAGAICEGRDPACSQSHAGVAEASRHCRRRRQRARACAAQAAVTEAALEPQEALSSRPC